MYVCVGGITDWHIRLQIKCTFSLHIYRQAENYQFYKSTIGSHYLGAYFKLLIWRKTVKNKIRYRFCFLFVFLGFLITKAHLMSFSCWSESLCCTVIKLLVWKKFSNWINETCFFIEFLALNQTYRHWGGKIFYISNPLTQINLEDRQ